MTIQTVAAGRQWTVASESKTNTLYIVKQVNGQLTCDCPAGFYRGTCKHVDAVSKKIAAPAMSPEMMALGLSLLGVKS